MKQLSKTLKQMLNALAYADAGEYLATREKVRILAQTKGTIEKAPVATRPVAAKSSRNDRRVALYMGSELPNELMDYVIQTCARLRHDLTVVTFESKNTSQALLEPYQDALRDTGIAITVVNLRGDHLTSMARYLRNHSEIAFLICKDLGYLGWSFFNGIQPNNALPVPVVIVASKNEVVGYQARPDAEQNSGSSVVA